MYMYDESHGFQIPWKRNAVNLLIENHFRRPSSSTGGHIVDININNARAQVIVSVLLLLLDIVPPKAAAKMARIHIPLILKPEFLRVVFYKCIILNVFVLVSS
jgi:hypothetical protein